MLTFCVLGHNESTTLLNALEMAAQAASIVRHHDSVVYVDSQSDDDSVAVAEAAGYRVVRAPIGKGRAVRAAVQEVSTPWVCLLDADIYGYESNIAAKLAEQARQNQAAMIIGDFTESDGGSILSSTWGIHNPLVSALFPEFRGRYGSKPLSGFRALRTDLELPNIPADFGVEAYLNLAVPLQGGRIQRVSVGNYEGRFRYKPTMGREIARPILDEAERTGRLAPVQRPLWDSWVESVVAVIASYHGERSDRPRFLADLRQAVGRCLPSATADRQPAKARCTRHPDQPHQV